jgi:hypothetical protein
MTNGPGDGRHSASLVVLLLVIALLCVAATAFIAFRDMVGHAGTTRDAVLARCTQSSHAHLRLKT